MPANASASIRAAARPDSSLPPAAETTVKSLEVV
jgi:hypothetical protein